jgi:hypothetical protein
VIFADDRISRVLGRPGVELEKGVEVTYSLLRMVVPQYQETFL